MILNINGTDKLPRRSPTPRPKKPKRYADVEYRKMLLTMLLTKHRVLRASLLASAGSLVGITLSSAVTIATPSPGDLFLAFRATGGTGASTSYIIDLGQGTQFNTTPPGSTITLNSIGDIGAVLVAAYGANLNTRSDLFWGIFGATDTVNPTLYATKERTDVNAQTTEWRQLTSGDRSSVKTEIFSRASGINGFQESEATPNSGIATLQANSGQASSYNFQVTNGGTDFGYQSQWSSIDVNFGGDVTDTTLDLYRLHASSPPVKYLGNFRYR